MSQPLWYRALGVARYLAYGLAVLAVYKLGVVPGLLVAAAVILPFEALWGLARARVEGVMWDERDEAVRLRASASALSLFLSASGLGVASVLALEELGYLRLEGYYEGLVDGYALAVVATLASYLVFSTLYSRLMGG